MTKIALHCRLVVCVHAPVTKVCFPMHPSLHSWCCHCSCLSTFRPASFAHLFLSVGDEFFFSVFSGGSSGQHGPCRINDDLTFPYTTRVRNISLHVLNGFCQDRVSSYVAWQNFADEIGHVFRNDRLQFAQSRLSAQRYRELERQVDLINSLFHDSRCPES